jgi:hypothetical protein
MIAKPIAGRLTPGEVVEEWLGRAGYLDGPGGAVDLSGDW